MPEYLEDPSVLTKEKLKDALLSNNVELPSSEQKKDVYVQLYLKNLTVLNKKNATLDAFSSDEELPTPVVSNRSRSGRKATKKTDKPLPEDLDVSELSPEGLKDELLKYGVNAGPIVASTRKLYERKLQKLLDQGPPEALAPPVVVTEIDSNHNGNSDSDRYSDKEDDTPAPVAEPEPEPEPEPVPIVERLVRSRGKTPVPDPVPVTTRTRSSQHKRVEKIAAGDQIPNNINSTPTGFSATRRPPIRGAAGRPLKSSDLWSPESSLLRTPHETTTTSTYTENRTVHRVSAASPSSASSSASRLVSAAPPPAVQASAVRPGRSRWLKLLLLLVVAGFLFFVYQAMETNVVSPFGIGTSASEPEAAPVGDSQ